nr:TetR/AcrR family transcriptional regulator [uncultured Microbacterium sp.]
MPIAVSHEERRQEAADAAWRLIGRRGVQGLTFRAVADELNRSTTAITHYFPDRDELMVYVASRVVDGWRREYDMLIADRDPEEAVGLLLLWALPYDDAQIAQSRAYISLTDCASASPAVQSRLAHWQEWLVDRIAGVIEAWREKAKLTDPLLRSSELAALLVSIMNGLAVNTVHSPEEWPLDRQQRLLCAFFATSGYPVPQVLSRPVGQSAATGSSALGQMKLPPEVL